MTGGGKNQDDSVQVNNLCDRCGLEFASLFTVEYNVKCADGVFQIPSQMCKQCVSECEQDYEGTE
jgi:hypothetical protein